MTRKKFLLEKNLKFMFKSKKVSVTVKLVEHVLSVNCIQY